MKNGKHLTALKATIAAESPALVILDPLSALLNGAIDENSNGEAQFIIGTLREILPETTALLVCAHVAKTERETSTSARGASAWVDGTREVLALRPLTPTERGKLPDGGASYSLLEFRKRNYAPERPPLLLRRGVDGVPVMADENALRKQAKGEADAKVLEALPGVLAGFRPITRREITGRSKDKEIGQEFRDAMKKATGCRCTTDDLDHAIGELLADGTLSQARDESDARRQILCLSEGNQENDPEQTEND